MLNNHVASSYYVSWQITTFPSLQEVLLDGAEIGGFFSITVTKKPINYLSSQESLPVAWDFCWGGVEGNFHFAFCGKFSTMSLYVFL